MRTIVSNLWVKPRASNRTPSLLQRVAFLLLFIEGAQFV